MSAEIITKEDLELFREALIAEIKEIFHNSSPEIHEWLKGSDVRKILNNSPGTLKNLRITGVLKASKIGGTFYYKKTDVERMLNTK